MKTPEFGSGFRPRTRPRVPAVHLAAVGTVPTIGFSLVESFAGTTFGLSMVVLGILTDNGGRA